MRTKRVKSTEKYMSPVYKSQVVIGNKKLKPSTRSRPHSYIYKFQLSKSASSKIRGVDFLEVVASWDQASRRAQRWADEKDSPQVFLVDMISTKT